MPQTIHFRFAGISAELQKKHRHFLSGEIGTRRMHSLKWTNSLRQNHKEMHKRMRVTTHTEKGIYRLRARLDRDIDLCAQ